MAKKKYSESELRLAKDKATAAVVEQQRKLGVPDVGGTAVDKFLDPILNKMAREEDAPKKKKQQAKVQEVDRDEVTSQHIGNYDWDLKRDKLTAHEGSWTPGKNDVLHMVFQKLMMLPDWKVKILATRDLCKAHVIGHPVQSCSMCERRERAYGEILLAAYKRYGNPFQKRDKKIIVNGR